MDDFILRSATEEDTAALGQLDQICFTDPWSQEAFEGEILGNNLAEYIVAEKNGEIAAYMGMWFIVDEGHITNVAVAPKFRGLGLGRKIVQAMIEYGKAQGLVRFTLEVRASNEIAQNLYKSFGFKAEGIRPEYYGDNKEDAIIMWLNEE
ncbi:MAG: ribosomal protein S18-alanine N-acetyltransferase [Anaerovoracaceae bacterium]